MERKEVIKLLTSDGAIYRFRGILACLDNHITDAEVIKAISQMKTDRVIVAGRSMSSYAYALLDILGAEKYSGTDPDTLRLISDLKKQQTC